MDDLQQKGVIRGQWQNYIFVVSNLTEIEQKLSK
jgi:hypothetical protein